MKAITIILALAALVPTPAFSNDKVKAGPRHGRVLEMESQNAEFFVEKDRTVSIAFYDAAMKKQPVATQAVSAIAEAPAGKAKLEFDKKGELLVSKAPLPAGEKYTVVVQVKATPNGKPRNFRIPLDLSVCKGCGNAEYACICND